MIPVYKPQGLTPLQAITIIKEQQPDLRDTTISYAGRLDPMAEGLLLLLVGDENKERHVYEALEKEYRFEILLGVSTDTYDLLGLISKVSHDTEPPPMSLVEASLATFLGKQLQPYPPYSSKPVNGKPLYAWAREGKLHEITIPEKEITITSLSCISSRTLSPAILKTDIENRIHRVSGNFRQGEILSSWQSFFASPTLTAVRQDPPDMTLLSCDVTCSSGTYVRSIAHKLGEVLNSGALAYSIKRTRVGNYTLDTALTLVPKT